MKRIMAILVLFVFVSTSCSMLSPSSDNDEPVIEQVVETVEVIRTVEVPVTVEVVRTVEVPRIVIITPEPTAETSTEDVSGQEELAGDASVIFPDTGMQPTDIVPGNVDLSWPDRLTLATFDQFFTARRYPPDLIVNWGDRSQPMVVHNNTNEVRLVYCSSDAGTVELFNGNVQTLTGQDSVGGLEIIDSFTMPFPGFLVAFALSPDQSVRISGVGFNANTPITDPDTGDIISGGHYNTWCEEKVTRTVLSNRDDITTATRLLVGFFFNNKDQKPNVLYFDGNEFVSRKTE